MLALQAAARGNGATVVVEGPAGIGKTALLNDFRLALDPRQVHVMAARGSELEQLFPFGVVRQLFEPHVTNVGEERRNSLFDGPAAAAADLMDPANLVYELDGDPSFAVLHSLLWLTINMTAEQPAVVVIDDLQWCDTASLRWIIFLLSRIDQLALTMVLGYRTHETGAEEKLLARIMSDSSIEMVRPAPLTPSATTELLESAFGPGVDESFSQACWMATQGNPLLLRLLTDALLWETVEPVAANASVVGQIGGHAVARTVVHRLSGVAPSSTALARAISVLGENSDLRVAAKLAEIDYETAGLAAFHLEASNILREGLPLSFVHPVVRTAVYEDIDHVQRAQMHGKAARLLAESHALPEQIAAHLVLTGPVNETWAKDALRDAAQMASGNGAPDVALTYLSRCAQEQISASERLDILIGQAKAARMSDSRQAVVFLQAALSASTNAQRRAEIAEMLCHALQLLGRTGDAATVVASTLADLGTLESSAARHLLAIELYIALIDPSQPVSAQRLAQLRALEPNHTSGSDALDCTIAAIDAYAGKRDTADRLRRGLFSGRLMEGGYREIPLGVGWVGLLSADMPEAIEALDLAVAHAHKCGSLSLLATAQLWRSRALAWRGQLEEAEQAARAAAESAQLANIEIGSPILTAFLADALIAQGRLSEATAAFGQPMFETPGPVSLGYWAQETWARLQRASGNPSAGLTAALSAGEAFEAVGGHNPALIAWRTEAALCLHALSQDAKAREYASDELKLARDWGAPRALGRALRISAVLRGGSQGQAMLEEAVDVLRASTARLELAHALADLGSSLRRSNRRVDARRPLQEALDIAHACSASPLAERAMAELRTAGARPRRSSITGVSALTPSELRVAEMAAKHATNREIAQALFVTPKTIEVHLGSAYRKLGITSRHELASALNA